MLIHKPSQRIARRFIASIVLLTAGLGLQQSAAAQTNPEAPYNLSKFHPVLDDSKLQAPTSSTLIPQGDFEDQSNQYFRLDATGQYMTFTVTGDSNRSELRQMSGDWQTSTPTWRKMIGEVKLFYPSDNSMNQYTFMQIHDTSNDPQSLNKPLIRLVWLRSRNNVDDHLWAAVRIPADPSEPISDDNLSGMFVDLGPRPSGFFKAEIKVQDNLMRVAIDNVNLLSMDVSYWDGLNNYFKAGVYNQDPGTSKVQFKSLKYYNLLNSAEGQVENFDNSQSALESHQALKRAGAAL